MKFKYRLTAVAILLLFTFGVLHAEDNEADSSKNEDDKWEVAVPAVPADTLNFTVTEGTWISVDVHPDGDRIVFDLAGDIYSMPIEGGEATLLSGGLPYEVQPRYSPDGKQILFTSDRGGGDNIWVMNADGSQSRFVTKENFRLLNNGNWHPGGEYIVARKHFTSERSLGAGEMWIYRLNEGGKGVQLTKKKNDQQDAGEPVFSPDGKFLYWSEDMSGGRTFRYNKDANGTIYMIRRLNMETGEIRNIINLRGGAVRPQVSPDGKTVAFVRRIRTTTALCLYDLESGEVRTLWDGLEHDQQEAWAIFGVYPGFDWTPDGKSIIIWAEGKIQRVDITTGAHSVIPFSADMTQVVAKALRFPLSIGESEFDVKVIRWPQMTHDGKKIIFQALGYLYESDRNGGNRRRLTKQGKEFEFAPSISPDGKKIIYTTWNDRSGGRIKTMKTGGGSVRTVLDRPGHYVSAAISPDGKSFVYHRGGGDGYRGRIWDEEPGIYIADIKGATKPKLLTREGSLPRFSPDGSRIYLQAREEKKAALISLNLLGSDRRVHVTSERAWDFRLSPDGKWLAFEELWNTYVTPFPNTSVAIEVAPKMSNLPVRKLSKEGGTYLNWMHDSKTISWSLGPDFSYISIDTLFEIPAPLGDSLEADSSSSEKTKQPEPEIVSLGWSHPADIPNTDIYLVGGRILPMHDMTIIANGVIHIQGNKITEIGSADEIDVPEGANTIDVTGKTVMPGFVDIHAHVGSSNQGIYAQQSWAFLANLAFGTTTIHDPSNNSQMIFAVSEMVKSGQMLGPRIFSTGTILYGAEGNFKTVIDKYQDAYDAVKRTKAWGAYSIKSYQQPRREQRQMVIKAGFELGMMVCPEGGSTLNHNISQILDGHTTIEHNIPVAPLYGPELHLLSRFGTAYTPTLVVSYGSLSGEKYWYQHTEVWKNERLSRFVPRSVIDPRSRRRSMAPDEEYYHIKIAETAAEIVRRGGNVEIGSHGQMQGLAGHWEMWMFVQGGMTNHEALRAATWMGARSLGMDHRIGSLQPGMLADLIVIDGDPLEDIRESENITYTMINGRLYDAMTLNQLEPTRTALPAGPFLDEVTSGDIVVQCCKK